MFQGNKLLIELNDSLSKSYCLSRDIIDAKDSIKFSLNTLDRKQTELSNLWMNFEKHIVNLRELVSIENDINLVTSWILNIGESLINEQQDIGTDLESCEELRRAHESLEMQCCETYGLYAELIYKIKDIIDFKRPLSMAHRDLLSQKQYMDFVCRSFANRLERRRNILITCVRFYRLVTLYFDRTSQVFDTLIVGNNIHVFEECVNNLEKLRESHNYLGKHFVH